MRFYRIYWQTRKKGRAYAMTALLLASRALPMASPACEYMVPTNTMKQPRSCVSSFKMNT